LPSFTTTEDLEGLSGWLLLVGFGLVVSPFVILSSIVTTNIPFLYGSKYQAFLATHPAVEGLIVFEVISNIIFIACIAALNYLFFTKRKAFPGYFILYLVTNLLVLLIDTFAANALFPSVHLTAAYTSIARTLLAALIWIPYMLVSRRVKATFVR